MSSLRRPVIAVAVPLVVAGAAWSAPAAGAAPETRSAPSLASSVSRGVCTTSLDDPQARAAVFTVRADRLEDSGSYGFSAVLQERTGKDRWTSLSGSAAPVGLGTFQPAATGAAKMIRKINVRGLRLGGSYRLKVRFRWTSATGKQTLTRYSAACTVKELRPNLAVVRSLGWTPGTDGGQVVYRAQLRVSRAAAFDDRKLTLAVIQGAALLGRATVQPLANGAIALVPGRVCAPGASITLRIEVAPAIEESTAADNELTVPCAPEQAAIG